MIKNTIKLPDYLYKYSSFDNSIDEAEHERRLKAILHDNRVWFSDPSKQNDLFEFMPRIDIGKTQNEKKKFKDWIYDSLKNKGMNRNERRLETSRLFKEFKKSPTILRDEFCNIIRSKSIYCLTEDPKSILMWAYYGDGHKGYCLKFCPQNNRYFSDHIFQVTYSTKYPIIKPWTTEHEETGKQSICTKSIEWEHECEWRLFGKKPGYNDFPSEVLSGVIIGCKMEQKYQDLIEKLCSERMVPLKILYTQPDNNEYIIHLVDDKSKKI